MRIKLASNALTFMGTKGYDGYKRASPTIASENNVGVQLSARTTSDEP